MSDKKFGISKILAVLTLLVGSFLRVYHLFQIDFSHEPFRLGGLFVEFSEQIAQNGFRFPVTIPYYSEGGIPFAYPPLGFYIEAFFLKLFPDQQVAIANLLPPLIAVLVLLLACLFFAEVFRDRESHLLAGLFACAFLINSFSNQIEAAGLAESLGSLALLAYFASIFRYRNTPNKANTALTGLALGLCVLSSPGSAIGASLLFVLLVAESLIKQKGHIHAWLEGGMIGATGMLVSAPYWLTVMLNHGRGFFILPVLAQFHTGGKSPYLPSLLNELANFNVTYGNGAFFWEIVIFLGLLWLLVNRKPAIPVAFGVLLIIPRESVWMIAIPAALLFAYGFGDVLLPLFRPVLDMSSRLKKCCVIGVTALAMLGLASQSFALVDALIADQQWKLTRLQFEGVKNAAALIPPKANVLVLGNDALLEWAPHLLQREVINTKFGLEWQPGKLEKINILNGTLQTAATWDDVLKAVAKMNGQSRIYVLSTQKRLLTALNKDSTVPFTLKLETSDVQVGVLGIP
jgi:hypothetical protein